MTRQARSLGVAVRTAALAEGAGKADAGSDYEAGDSSTFT